MILGYTKQHILNRLNKYIIKIPFSDCHYWIGGLGRKNGYGSFQIREKGNRENRKQFKPHRLIYELLIGPIKDKHVLHKCDNPCCVNPNHLFLGTHQDNMLDMATKQRHSLGSKSYSAKLTIPQVQEIRDLYATKQYTTRQLGKMFNLDHGHVGRIIRHEKWKILI